MTWLWWLLSMVLAFFIGLRKGHSECGYADGYQDAAKDLAREMKKRGLMR